jgi:hypothetical protein
MKVVKMIVIVLLAIFCFISLDADQKAKTDNKKDKAEIINLPGLEALESLKILGNLEIHLDGLEALESLKSLKNLEINLHGLDALENLKHLDVSLEGLKGLEVLKNLEVLQHLDVLQNLDVFQDLDEAFEFLEDLDIDVDRDELFETPKIEKKKEKEKK